MDLHVSRPQKLSLTSWLPSIRINGLFAAMIWILMAASNTDAAPNKPNRDADYIIGCPREGSWIKFGDDCFHPAAQLLSFDDAYDYCHNTLNTKILMIDTEEEQKAIIKELKETILTPPNKNVDVWIGLHRLGTQTYIR